MTISKKPEKKRKVVTDWERITLLSEALEPIDTSEMPEVDQTWFETAEISYPGQISVEMNIDQDTVTWFRKHWPKFKQRMNQVLRTYKEKRMTPLALPQSIDQVLVVGKFDSEVVDWLKDSGPNYEYRINLMLRDFMEWCISKGVPSGDKDKQSLQD